HQTGTDRRSWNKKAREINLGNEVRVVDQAIGARCHHRGEEGPRQQASVRKYRIWLTRRGHPAQPPEQEREDDHGEEWLKYCPSHTQRRLLIADLNVSLCEDVEELPMRPHIEQFESCPSVG